MNTNPTTTTTTRTEKLILHDGEADGTGVVYEHHPYGTDISVIAVKSVTGDGRYMTVYRPFFGVVRTLENHDGIYLPV